MTNLTLPGIRSWLWSWFQLPAQSGPLTEGRSYAELADVTRWAWLPALSGVSLAGDHARKAHEAAVGAPEE
ncbi:hypothetical protein [Arthrobacter rhizosphaerae]|uniref:hypothetical protein n=1 Tax=Arthrobacter rhizosphaerae TaxID=2855490 RepID=UPI001FF232F2|nr:hypothetical protein [Arthrobacter rhizosphaerae]